MTAPDPRTASISELLERVREAKGADRELGVRILALTLGGSRIVAIEQSPINGEWCAYTEGWDGRRRIWETPSPFRQMSDVTASIDAALALVERKASEIGTAPDVLLVEAIEQMTRDGFRPCDQLGPQIARALIAALLLALQSNTPEVEA